MTRRLSLTWPDPAPFSARDQRPIRILAASDEDDPALDFESNRASLGQLDLVAGAGDLSPERLAFLADAFQAPMVFVRGNHDRGGPWPEPELIPLPASGLDTESLPGIPILALPWPTSDTAPAVRDERAAWWQVLRTLNRRLLLPGARPWLVISHVPPRDVGDTPSDPYHVGFAAYRTVLHRLRPPLWVHGHTTRASSPILQVVHGRTTAVNVTGSVLIELLAPGAATRGRRLT
jgi:calcineurin-like phosphoesterase family protein